SRAGRGVAGSETGGTPRARRHAATRSRQLSAADGARVARFQRRAHAAAVERQRIRGRENHFTGAGRENQRAGIVWRNRDEATKTRKHETRLDFLLRAFELSWQSRR